MALEFSNEKIMLVRKEMEVSSLDSTQLKIVNMFIPVLKKHIPTLSELVLKGMFRFSVREFVDHTGISSKEMINKPVEEVKFGIRGIFDILYVKLSNVLRYRADEDLLRKAIDSAYDVVIQKRTEMERNQSK